MGYTIELSRAGAPDQLFAVTPLFNFELNQEFSDQKRTSGEIRLPFVGKFVGVGPDVSSSAIEQFLALLDFCNYSGALSSVRIKLNATLKREFKPADFEAGPFVENLRSVPPRGEDPNFVNEVEFTFEIVGRLGGSNTDQRQGGEPELRTVVTDYFNERFVRKTWTAQAKGPLAIPRLRGMEPPSLKAKALVKSEIRQVDANTFQVDFVWDRWQTDKLIRWTERVQRIPGTSPKVVTLITGKRPPIVREARQRPTEIVVEGEIEANTELIDEPGPYLDPKFLDGPRSLIGSTPQLIDKAGIFLLQYRQVFVGPDDKLVALPNREIPKPADKNFIVEDDAAPGFLGG